MGHKEDSHKKGKMTRLEDTDEKLVEKKLRFPGSPASVAAPPVVTQTQEQLQEQDAPDNATTGPRPTVGSAVTANNNAIADMAAGNVDEATANDSDGTTMAFALERLQLFRVRTLNQKAVKLTPVLVFAFLCKPFVPSLIEDLDALQHLRASSLMLVKKAANGFDTAIYTRSLKVAPGKSCRQAANLQKEVIPTTITPDVKYDVNIMCFDIKKVNKLVGT
jgi:hypothetical protein